jgi:hypothetical protein
MKTAAIATLALLAGLSIDHLFAESRLVTVSGNVGDFVTAAQDKQNTIDGCYVVVENLMIENMKYKKTLGM